MHVTIERLTHGDHAIAHTEDGKTLFVEGGCPGDVCDVEIVDDKKRFAFAHISELIVPSSDRITPPCSPQEFLSGAPWAHISYDAQLAAKFDNVHSSLKRLGGFDDEWIKQRLLEVIPSKKTWGYRNKLELVADFGSSLAPDKQPHGSHRPTKKLGMTTPEGQFLALEKSSLIDARISTYPKAISGALAYALKQEDYKLLRVGLRHSVRTKSTEIALWTEPGPFPRSLVAQVLQQATKATSIVRVLIKGPAKARKVTKVEVLSGSGFWEESFNDVVMRFSAPSFFQVNTPGAERLVDLALDFIQPDEASTVFDLYSGAGTFTVPLALSGADVYAVESSGPTVRDLRRNLELNYCDAEVIGGDAAREIKGLGHADAIIVDPPRAGLHPDVVDTLATSDADKIVYVSCDHATLARDLKAFMTYGTYNVERIQPVDLFPQTHHVECVCLMTRVR